MTHENYLKAIAEAVAEYAPEHAERIPRRTCTDEYTRERTERPRYGGSTLTSRTEAHDRWGWPRWKIRSSRGLSWR